MKTFLKSIFILFVLTIFSSGCSVIMATQQPKRKDVELFKVGTSRSVLLAEFGFPEVSETREDNKKYEIFCFTQGYSTGAKVGRAVFHAAADVFTLCLWEVVGTPTEIVFDGEEIAFEVRYDAEDKVDQVVLLKKK